MHKRALCLCATIEKYLRHATNWSSTVCYTGATRRNCLIWLLCGPAFQATKLRLRSASETAAAPPQLRGSHLSPPFG
eukprot:6165909-Prymnesium_polylepis.1